MADLSGVDLRDADLTDAHLDNIRADGALFIGAKLTRTSLCGAHLSRANLCNADLTTANLSYADLTGVDLTGAILDDVKVEAAIFNDVRGLSPEAYRDLRGRAARWRHDLKMSVRDFLRDCSFPLHLMLTALAIVLARTGRQTTAARRSFTLLIGINVASLLPLLLCVIMGLLGGSRIAQMSVPSMGLWSMWVCFWPLLLVGMGSLLFGSLVCGGVHLIRHAIMPPRHRVLLSWCCVLATVANIFFATQVLLQMAPLA
jgi:uncharacterized protein YjbI with pentapeptide repeats